MWGTGNFLDGRDAAVKVPESASGKGDGSGRDLSTSAGFVPESGLATAAGRRAGGAWGLEGDVSAAAVPSDPETMTGCWLRARSLRACTCRCLAWSFLCCGVKMSPGWS